MLLKQGVLTSGLIKSKNPRLPKTPPGLAAASFNSCAALAIARTLPAMFSKFKLPGPTPNIHLFVYDPKSAVGMSQSSNTLAIPSKPSAFPLNNPSISPLGNILATPPIASANSVLIPFIISLNNAPIN